MNILMVSHYAGAPQYGMEYRSYYMAREWVRMGHKVMIVGAAFSHLRHHQPSPGHETLEGIEYLWLPTRTYQGNGIARVLTMLQFVAQVFRRRASLAAFKPHIVIASSVYTFDIYPCRLIARRSRAKLVYEVHDLWPLSPMVIGGYSRLHPFIFLLQQGENYAYRHCDMVVSMLDKALPHMRRHGLDPTRFCCIPNGFLREEWGSSQADPTTLPQSHTQLLRQLHDQGRIVVGFAGGHTQSTAMDILIRAAQLLPPDSPAAFVLVGQGPQKEELQALAHSLGLTSVHFLPPVDKSAIPALLSLFDICYAGGVHSILHQYGTSFNKVTDYMMAARPILFAVDEPHSLVERVGCGLQVEAENPAAVASALERLCAMTDDQRQSMGLLGRQYALANLDYTTLAQRFIHTVCNTPS